VKNTADKNTSNELLFEKTVVSEASASDEVHILAILPANSGKNIFSFASGDSFTVWGNDIVYANIKNAIISEITSRSETSGKYPERYKKEKITPITVLPVEIYQNASERILRTALFYELLYNM